MVVPIREIGNKFFLFLAIMNSTTNMTLPTVNVSAYTRIDFSNTVRNTSDNYEKMRDRTSTPNKHSSRDSLMSSTILLVVYSKQMEINNDIDSDVIIDAANSPQLSYAIPKE